MIPDGELLRRYAETNSESAFTELVKRHLALVYSAALRQVNGDAHLAQDVAQTVFADLARKAASLAGRPVLTGWLYTSAHFAAAKAVRAEQRRHTREEEAHLMNQLLCDTAPDPDWERLRPVLDAAMLELNEADREAVLLRYFDNRPHAEIAGRLGLSENAARMRVERALEKLHALLVRRGVSSTAALSAVISANAVQVAPAGLAATLSTAALAGTTLATTTTATAIKSIAMTTLQKTLITATVAVLAGAGIYEARQASRLRAENAAFREQTNQLAELDQLRADKQRLADQLKTELARPQAEHGELLRLRGRVTGLRQAEQENVRLKTEREALVKQIEDDFQMRRDKMNYLGNWGLALKVYARTNDGRLPTSLAEAAPSMPNPDVFFSAIGARFRDDQFEMACKGSLTNLGDPTGIIVVREKEPVRIYNGKWARTYLFADGHTEVHFAADGDFTAWEQERLPPRNRP
jgi:RNA polymerase sigma factor (sigma-70 family)